MNDPAYAPLARRLQRFKARETIATVAALFTYPRFQANTARLEVLLHLAIAHCQGGERATLKELNHWLNKDLSATHVWHMEEPPEDVFVSNVLTPWGNVRLLEGVWERNDFHVQQLVDLMQHPNTDVLRPLRPYFRALLSLSEAALGRLGLARWTKEESSPRAQLNITAQDAPRDRARALFFSRAELLAMHISNEALAPFTFPHEKRHLLLGEEIGNTSLERHPLIHFGDAVLLASPTSVSAALRRLTLGWCEEAAALPLCCSR